MKAITRPYPAVLSLMASAFMVVAFNASFWQAFMNATGGISLGNIPLYAATFIILVLFFNAVITLLTFRPIIKPLLTLLFCVTSVVAYFMDQYGTAIDAVMIQNVLETNTLEAVELISWRMVLFFMLFGVLPSALVWRTQLDFPSIKRNLSGKFMIVSISLVVMIGLLLIFYKSYASTFRGHRELRFFLTPLNYIQATNSYIKRKFSHTLAVAPLGTDASRGVLWKEQKRKTVTVIVLGETARAMNFSLNGYGRNTNPELSRQEGLINFTNVQSCGTATAVSVPCVFSALGRANYSESAAKSQEGLLDVLSHAGFGVLWRNNNSGCKGTCDRVEYENFAKPVAGEPLCNTEECYDEYLLKGLPERIRSSQKDMVIVLHQKGSHGPSYWKRYPDAFKRFGPVCETNELQKCSSEAIVNAYDNTILYTDHFISKVIDLLRKSGKEDGVDTSFIYFSDHGESLGEKGMYLHGAPYMISPDEQRHVPFMIWLSDSFRSRFRIDATCLAARRDQSFSHDNVFHSVLGMLNVDTATYNPALDIFQACSQASTSNTLKSGA